ncbi:MAG TPA: cohesin domain-containing protein [Anaerolineae bacterium]|jgi:hypothetical protein
MNNYLKRLAISLTVLASLALSPSGVQAITTPQVVVNPQGANTALCQTIQMSVNVVDVVDLYGFDISMNFDPRVVSVVSADPGPFLDAGFIIKKIDNVAGTLRFVLTQINPSVAKSGSGSLIYFTARGRMNGLTSSLTLTQVNLAKRDSSLISAALVSGSVAVTAGDDPNMPVVTDVVTDTVTSLPVAGATVALTDSLGLVYTTTATANGSYELSCSKGQSIMTGSGMVLASKPGYTAAADYNPFVVINPGTNKKTIPLTPQSLTIHPLYFGVDGTHLADVYLGWTTSQEVGTTGFNLFRAESSNPAQALLIHFETSQSPALGAAYRYTDTLEHSGVYWYWLTEVGTAGVQAFPGPVSATVIIYNHFYWMPVIRLP